MDWHWTEFSSLFHHLPHSVEDLLRHEDEALVKAGLGGLKPAATEQGKKPRLILGDSRLQVEAPPSISIEKNIDPGIARSQQNLHLLIHDYLHTLPDYHPHSKEAEILLAHWRKILTEQPQRLAEARETFWNSGQAKLFWQERIRHTRPDHIIYDEDWTHTAAAGPMPDIATQGARKEKQWQDMVLRTRMHQLTELHGIHY